MNTSGKLDLYLGPMFSGKSTELIRKIRRLKVINSKYLVIKPSIDNRYDKNRIVSHNKESEDCIIVSDLNEIDDHILVEYKTIIIDEGQFLKNLKNKVLYWVDVLNKHVIIGGLDSDFKRNPIGEIIDLIPHADNYIKLHALCKKCNNETPGIFSHRIATNCDDQIMVGSDNLYIPLCRKHYLEENTTIEI